MPALPWLFWLVTFVRVLGVVTLVPTGSTALTAIRARLALAVVLTILVGASRAGEIAFDTALPVVLAEEFALGACFGFGIRVLFLAAQVVAELLDAFQRTGSHGLATGKQWSVVSRRAPVS